VNIRVCVCGRVCTWVLAYPHDSVQRHTLYLFSLISPDQESSLSSSESSLSHQLVLGENKMVRDDKDPEGQLKNKVHIRTQFLRFLIG